MGNEVGPTRQHLPDRTDCQGYVLDAVEDCTVLLGENQVAVLAHQLHDQGLAAEIPHFIQMLDMKMENSLERGLGDRDDAPAAQVLSKQHAKARCGHGCRFIFLCQIDQGQTG